MIRTNPNPVHVGQQESDVLPLRCFTLAISIVLISLRAIAASVPLRATLFFLL